MQRQDELEFIKSISNVEVSPLFLRELKKAVAAGKKKKTLAAHKDNALAGEPSQSVNWGRRLAQSASRRPPVC